MAQYVGKVALFTMRKGSDSSGAEHNDPRRPPWSGRSHLFSRQPGESQACVEKIPGTPDQVLDLGSKKILLYKRLKVTLVDDKVTDAQ